MTIFTLRCSTKGTEDATRSCVSHYNEGAALVLGKRKARALTVTGLEILPRQESGTVRRCSREQKARSGRS